MPFKQVKWYLVIDWLRLIAKIMIGDNLYHHYMCALLTRLYLWISINMLIFIDISFYYH